MNREDVRREVPYGASTAARRAAAEALSFLSSGDSHGAGLGAGAGAGAPKRPRIGPSASLFSRPSWHAAEALAVMSRGLGVGSGACDRAADGGGGVEKS
jgi:hypothetical protein